jgi:hypothetical protein
MNFSLLLACATCIGQSGQQDVGAANGAVFVMIGALGVVFLGIMGVLITIVRRARRTQAATA